MAKPISETRNATDVSVLVWFIISWRENSKTQQKKSLNVQNLQLK